MAAQGIAIFMRKGESHFEQVTFLISFAFKVLTPPYLSLERLERFCKARIDRNPAAYSPRWLLADLYMYARRYEEALIEYDELDRLGYLEERQQFSYAEANYRLKNFEEAIKLLLAIRGSYRNDKTFSAFLGMSFFQKGFYGEALPYLNQAAMATKEIRLLSRLKRSTPPIIDEATICECIAFSCFTLGELQRSADAYRKVLTLDPNGPRTSEIRNNIAKAHIHLANRLLSQRQKDEAIRQFHLALEVQPEQSISHEILKTLSELGVMAN